MKNSAITLIFTLLIYNIMMAQDSPELAAWRDQKYSMFIHYGIYSVLGGVWDGKPISRGLSEQIQAHAGIYSDTYAQVARRFNPVLWNADSIALLAKDAGMRSIVITSKHHDGFCMFHSAYTEFNVVDATPFKRDIIRELSDACRRHGLKFGIYFSLIDWHFPQASPISSHNSDVITPEHHEYNKKQVTELLTRYGPISELWFDMGSQSRAQSRELRELVHRLQKDCLVSSRIGNDQGDFTVMGDNQEPDYSIGVPWQSPASFFDETWGYRSWQKRGSEEEKVKEKLSSLIRVVSRGGNYLLNIGPMGDGSVVPFEKRVLRVIRKWLQTNGEAIYSTQPDPFHVKFPWGSITSRPNKLYLHILTPPANNVIVLPGITGSVKRASVLSTGATITFTQTKQGLTIRVPATLSNTTLYPVVTVEFKNGFVVTPDRVVYSAASTITLDPSSAFNYYSNSGIDYNTRYQSTIRKSWTIEPGSKSITPLIYYSDEESGKQIDITIGNTVVTEMLNGGTEEGLQQDLTSLEWSPLYIAGPFSSGLEGSHGSLDHIVPANPWPSSKDASWTSHPEWKTGTTHTLPAENMSAYYVLQEITSPKEQSVLLGITSGDGVVVFVNNIQIFINLEPDKKEIANHIVQVPLIAGKNQVVVKLFNNFHNKINFALRLYEKQVVYKKTLSPVVGKQKYLPVILQLHAPSTPHDDLKMPNLRISIQKN